MRPRLALVAFPGLLFVSICAAQSTDGMISGRVTNAIGNQPIADVSVVCTNLATHTLRTVRTGPGGLYTLPLLPPGAYELQLSRDGFQSKEQDEIQLGVADSLELNFSLRPVQDIWESALHGAVLLPQNSAIVNFYGPDVDPNHWAAFSTNPGKTGKLEASISDAVSPSDIRELPLSGNNIYSVLLAEPGVAADNASTRSLGIAANGQRPSSANFLLDGVESNLYLTSGPLLSIAPEATQEYRLSTNSFSAEYGGAAGFIANVVTRSGGDAWHGLGFFDLENTVLDGNDFQANLGGLPRIPLKEDRVGLFAGGPIWKNRLFTGSSFEYFRSRSQQEPFTYDLPNTEFLNFLGCPSSASLACQLLRNYPISSSTALDSFLAGVKLSEPVSVDQWLGLERLDYIARGGSQHAGIRFAVSNLSRPDFIWSPYRDYISGLDEPVFSVAANWTASLRPNVTNQMTSGWNDERISWARANPDVPTLVAGGNAGAVPLLPGSPAAYGLNNSGRVLQLNDSLTVVNGRHILTAGGGAFWRRTDDFLGYGLNGEYFFQNIVDFGIDLPSQFTAAVSRQSPLTQPDLSRSFRSSQFFGFVQDTFRVTPRMVVNFGLRYDYFGAPSSVGTAQDWTVQFGAGTSFDQRLANASLQPPSHGNSIFSSNSNFAPRLGFGYDISQAWHLLLRGGFGLFHDRLFDNLWLNIRNNSFVLPVGLSVTNPDYLAPIASVLPSYAGQTYAASFPNLTAFQPNLDAGYAEDFFLGIKAEPATGWTVELNGAGSLGRKLITTDILNRNRSVNPSLPAISYLGNQGLSDYYSLNLVTRWRSRHGFIQAAYTWSHAIDLQSDPLAGDFLNLDFVNVGPAPGQSTTAPNGASFSAPNDSRGDRGSADFDQRHTFIVYSYYELPGGSGRLRWLRGFRVSEIAGLRSGFPYSIFTAVTNPQTIDARARPVGSGNALLASPQSVSGGQRIFEASSFCANDACAYAPSGRNAFAGPGLINLDVSLSRTVHLGENRLLTLRADFFNFLNHPNLNPPGNIPNVPGYGIALFGSPPQAAGFPSLLPLAQTSRQIQLVLRFSF